MYLFPYTKIEQGSRIIIYGAGMAGMDYYEQVKVSKYANVLCMVDKDWEVWKESENILVPVIGKDDILQYYPECDYIIISIRQKETAESVRRMLLEMGIEDKKIQIPDDASLHDYVQIRRNKCIWRMDIKDLLDKEKRSEIIQFFQTDGKGCIQYLEYLIIQIKMQDKDSETYQQLLSEIFAEQNLKHKIILIYLIIEAKGLDQNLFREYVKTISALEDLEERYIYLTDTALFPLFFYNCVYREFYLEMREGYRNMMEAFQLKIPFKEDRKHKKETLIFLLPPLLGECTHGNYINGVIEKFDRNRYECHIFFMDIAINAGDNQLPKTKCGWDSSGGKTRFSEKKYIEIFGKDVQLEYVRGNSIKKRLQTTLTRIYEINPSLIIDVTDETMPLSYLLVKEFPILYIPLRGFVSSMFFTKMLVEGKKAALYANHKFPSIEEAQMFECYINFPEKAPERRWKKKEFGWKHNDFIMVTVGDRLPSEMSEEFMKNVCELMKKDREIKWLIIGCNNIKYLSLREDLIKNGQIIFAGYQPDLAGIFQICDAYINPQRTGGGVSQRIAISNGVPVVADATQWFDEMEAMGWDNLCWGLREQIEKIEKMKMDRSFLKEELYRQQNAVLRCKSIAESDLLVKECEKMIMENKKIRNLNHEM